MKDVQQQQAGAPNQGASAERSGKGLSWRLMVATESACKSVCYAEESAIHCQMGYTMLDRWVAWWQGFVAGWLGDSAFTPLVTRVCNLFRKKVPIAQSVGKTQGEIGETETMVDCSWTEDTPDACPYCAGALCALCGAGTSGFRGFCEHGSWERHHLPEQYRGADEGNSSSMYQFSIDGEANIPGASTKEAAWELAIQRLNSRFASDLVANVKTHRRTMSRTWEDMRIHAQYHLDCERCAAEHYDYKLSAWQLLSLWCEGAATGFFEDDAWMPISWRLMGRSAEQWRNHVKERNRAYYLRIAGSAVEQPAAEQR